MQAQSCCPQPAGEASEPARVVGVPSRGAEAKVLGAADHCLGLLRHTRPECVVLPYEKWCGVVRSDCGDRRPGHRGRAPGTAPLGRAAAPHLRGRSPSPSPLRRTDAHSRVHHRTTDHRPHSRPPATHRANSPTPARSAQTPAVQRYDRLGLEPRCTRTINARGIVVVPGCAIQRSDITVHPAFGSKFRPLCRFDSTGGCRNAKPSGWTAPIPRGILGLGGFMFLS